MHERALATELSAPSRGLSEDWVAAELHFVRLAAQAEADAAYEDWRQHPGALPYAVYRAAQDRADAAQEHLAQWLSRSPGD